MFAGSPVSYRSFADDAKAIVWTSYNGSEGGTALAEVLFGAVNPSGKLPETIGKKLEDYPTEVFGEFATHDSVTYKEDIYVGYRYFDSYQVEPEFCFGHGLSYTEFAYSEMVVQKVGNEIKVTGKVTNVGSMDGAEVVQVYVSYEDKTVPFPAKELKGFEKVFLGAGETKEVQIVIPEDALTYYDESKNAFCQVPGAKVIRVGSSSRDVRGEFVIE